MTPKRQDGLIGHLRTIWRYGRKKLFGKKRRRSGKQDTVSLPDLPKANIWPVERRQIHHWLHSLNIPIWRSVTDAAHMRPDDPVLGVYLRGQAWALPWWIMKNHHVANLHLDGQPVLVVLCEMCSSAAAFHAVADNQPHTFGQSGQYNGSILLSDDQTGSYWAPWTGEALSGTSKGHQLERLPLYQSLWHDWLAEHPTSQVLYAEQSAREGHGSSFSPGSPGIGGAFRGTLLRPLDERLPHNTLVLGVTHQGVSRAYPLEALDKSGAATNDLLGDEPIVVLHKPGTYQALAFSARLHDDVLEFDQNEQGQVIDRKTASRWAVTGTATSGPLQGAQLAFVRSGVEEWYIRAAYHPETTIFGAEAVSWGSTASQDIEADHDHH